MVTVRLRETGEELDIIGGKITLVKQVNDIGDVTKMNSTYSWSFEFPKTKPNTVALRGLGFVGDISNVPYEKTKVDVLDSGIPIVIGGLLNVRETSDKYKAFVQEGIVEFFKTISVDNIGEVIDLSEIDHQTTPANVVSSFGNSKYRYIIADYNGQELPDSGAASVFSTLGLIPSINIKYLWDKIFDYYGWTYTGIPEEKLNELWMTYPNGAKYSEDNVDLLLQVTPKSSRPVPIDGNPLVEHNLVAADPAFIGGVAPYSKFYILQNGEYKIKLNVKGTFYAHNPDITGRYDYQLWVNGLLKASSSSDQDVEVVYNFSASAGDSIEMRFKPNIPERGLCSVDVGSYMKIETLGTEIIDFTKALINFKVSSFFKEIGIRLGVTAFADVETKNIDFMSIEERLSTEPINWSDKFVERISEEYVYESYAQNNYFRHKYEEQGEDYKDGVLKVANENLDIEKDLYKSDIWAPFQQLSQYRGFYAPVVKMYDVELKEDKGTGEFIPEYKPLKSRFYILKQQTMNKSIKVEDESASSFPLAVLSGTTYDEIIPIVYDTFNQLLNKTRIHTIKLFLSKWEVANIDLKKTYFFEQEASEYIINKITWKGEKFCEGEFVKIRR